MGYGSKLEGVYQGVSYQGMSRKLLALARPYWQRVLPLLFLQTGAALLTAAATSLALPLLQVIAGGVRSLPIETLPWLGRTYAGWLIGRSLIEQLQLIAAAFVVIGIAKSSMTFWAEIAANRFTLRLAADLRLRMLDLYLGAEYQFFLDRKQGRILNDLNEEPGRAAIAISLFLGWIQQFLSAACLLAVLLVLSWPATLVACAVGSGLAIALARLRFVAMKVGQDGLVNKRDLGSLGAEVISGIRQIKLFGAENRVRQQSARLLDTYTRIAERMARLTAIPELVKEMIMVLMIGLLFLFLGWAFPDRLVTMLPVAGAFVIVLRQLMPVIATLSAQRVKLYAHVPVLDFVLGTFRDLPSEHSLRGSGKGVVFRGLSDQIAFENVTFTYRRSARSDVMPTFANWMEKRLDGPDEPISRENGDEASPVLQKLNIIFERGKCTAVIGPSGVGKSTVVDLLVRLFDPEEGRITVDGVNLRDIDLVSWRAHIGYVSQDTFIFHGTIRDNIAFAKPDATRAEVEDAARLANAHDFIVALPQGYETNVGDRGMKLSGGQRQRIAIARALIRDPSILILDEATSALDSEAERVVQHAIEQASRGRTLIVISHRLSMVTGADMIYVLGHGRIVEAGRHDELWRLEGPYARLCRMFMADTGM